MYDGIEKAVGHLEVTVGAVREEISTNQVHDFLVAEPNVAVKRIQF